MKKIRFFDNKNIQKDERQHEDSTKTARSPIPAAPVPATPARPALRGFDYPPVLLSRLSEPAGKIIKSQSSFPCKRRFLHRVELLSDYKEPPFLTKLMIFSLRRKSFRKSFHLKMNHSGTFFYQFISESLLFITIKRRDQDSTIPGNIIPLA